MKLPIEIASTDRQNADLFVGFGLVLILVNFAFHMVLLERMAIANMFLYCFAGAMLLLGYLKQSEPHLKFRLTEVGIEYYHRQMVLQLPWENIKRIGQPQQDRLTGGAEYDYIGIQFKDVELFYDNFPLRLASKLLTQQRQLWLAVAGTGCATGQCVPEDFIDSVETKLPNGRVYKGLVAMFVHRCETLNQHLGYHLYLPLGGVEYSSVKLLNLLQETKNQVLDPKFNSHP